MPACQILVRHIPSWNNSHPDRTYRALLSCMTRGSIGEMRRRNHNTRTAQKFPLKLLLLNKSHLNYNRCFIIIVIPKDLSTRRPTDLPWSIIFTYHRLLLSCFMLRFVGAIYCDFVICISLKLKQQRLLLVNTSQEKILSDVKAINDINGVRGAKRT